MSKVSQVKKASQLRDTDKKVLLAYANIVTETEIAPKSTSEGTVNKNIIYKLV